MDFHGMKRKELQALCKKHGIPANLTNREMADRLTLLLKEDEKSITEDLGEIESEIDSVVVTKNVKKVRFSPENETFIFVGTDVESELDSDSDYDSKSKKKNGRKRSSTSKNVEKKKKNVQENPVRVTRSRDDSKVDSLAVAGRKRGRRGKEAAEVCDKPPWVVDLGDDVNGFPARGELKREEVTRQLRSRKVVTEAGGNGDLAVPSKKIGSKKTRDGKGSHGVLVANETFEENVIAEAAKAEKITKRSKQNLTKDEGSSALSGDLGKTGTGGRTRRSQTRNNGSDFAVDGECGIVETKKESRSVLQLEEPVKGLGRNSLRRKSVVVGKKERVAGGILAGERIEHEPMLKRESRKRSKKTEAEDDSKVEPSGEAVKQVLLPDGPSRRTRRNTRLFSPAASISDGQLTTHETAGKVNPSREAPLERGPNVIAKPFRKSTRNASKQISTEISDKLGEVAEVARKHGRKKQTQEPILDEPSSVVAHEPVKNKPLKRSSRNISKGNIVELRKVTTRGTEKNKQHEVRKTGGSLTKCTLPLKEPPVIDELSAAEASISRTEPDFFCSKEDIETSGKIKRLNQKSTVISQLSSVQVSSVNNEVVDITPNLVVDITPYLVVDITPSLESQVSTSPKFQGTSMSEQKQVSVTEQIVMGKESNIIEENRENFLEKNVEGNVDDQLCSSLNKTDDSTVYKLVETLEYPKHLTNAHLNSLVNGFSPTNYADSEGECSNLLDINEGLETEQGRSINQESVEIDDQPAQDSKANIEEDQYLVELNPNGNLEPAQGHINEVNGSQKSERNSENSFQEAEKTCPSEPAPESQDKEVGDTNINMCLDHDIVTGAFTEEGEPGSLPHFTLDKLQEGKDCEPQSALNEIASASCEIIREASNEVKQSLLQIQQLHFGELDDREDVALELNRSASFAANNLMSKDGNAYLEEKLGGTDSKSYTKDYSERGKEHDVFVTTDATPCNMDDNLVKGEVFDKNVSDHGVVQNHAHENIQVPQAEADATCTNEKIDCKNLETSNKWEEEYSSEVNLSINISCDSPAASSRFGDVHGSHNVSGDRIDMMEKELMTDDRGDGVTTKSKPRGCRNNEDLLAATNNLSQENDAITSEFSQAPSNDHNGALEDADFVNDTDCMISNQHLCGKENENNTKQTEEALDSHAPDNKPFQTDHIKDVVALKKLPFLSPLKPNMDVGCLGPSPGILSAQFDNRNSELHVQSAAIITLEMDMDLGNGEKDIEKINEVLVKANLEGKHGEEHKEVEEKLTMTEEFDRVSERQLGEHEQHQNESTDSKELISGDNERPNEQDDASAIIQEYLDHEAHMDGFLKTKDSNAFVHEGPMTGVAEIKGYETGAAEDRETNTMAELGIDNMLKESGEKDKEAYAMTTGTTEVGEETGSLLLSVGVERAHGIEFPKLNDAALGDSNDIDSANHEDSEKPNETVEPMLQNDEAEFGDLDGSVSMASDNSGFRDGKTENNEVNIGRMEDSSNSPIISVHAETKHNIGVVPDVTTDDISDNLVEDELHAWNDTVPDTILVNSQDNKIVSTDEAGDESSDRRTDFDNVEDGIKLAGEPPISPRKFEDDCRWDEKTFTSIKSLADTAVGKTLTGEESPCDAYMNLFTEGIEVTEMVNTDRGIGLKGVDSPIQGSNELGTEQRGLGYNRSKLKEGGQTDDLDCLDLSNLFSSNNKKINSKSTGETFDLHSPENVEVSSFASKDNADVEEVLSITKPEVVECSGVCSVTADASSECMRPMPHVLGNTETLDRIAEMPLYIGFELNLHSERDEVEKIYARNLKGNLMGETSEKVKNEEDTVVGISEASAEQLRYDDNGMVVEVEIPKQNQLSITDEPVNEIEESKQKGIVSVIPEGCLDHKDESFKFEESTEATIVIVNISTGPTEMGIEDINSESTEAIDVIGNISTAPMDTGSEDINSFVMRNRSEDMVETLEMSKEKSEVTATNMDAALDEPISENGGSTEKGKQVENCLKIDVAGVTILIRNNPSEDMVETTELSKDVLEIKATSLSAASDEPIMESKSTEEESNIVSVLNQECVDCEYDKDDSVVFETSIETTEINGCSSAASLKPTEECCGKDSKQVEVYGNSDLEGMQFPGKNNPSEDVSETMELSKGDSELKGTIVDQFSAPLGNVASDDAETGKLKLESHQENGREREGIGEFAKLNKKNNDWLIPATPKNHKIFHDMKENLPSTKREQVGSITASKRSQRRRPLEDLLKN